MNEDCKLSEGEQRRFEWLRACYSLAGVDFTIEAFLAYQRQEQMVRKYGNDNL